ncbi:LacI family DNA-binding transcriptional regulator [Demequina sp. SYSU T00039]|uniref:LacI family DNA-binding transcriptional regulator n=1 Tax=Demequina lignilytica TaxID=3051663 RepID=A0AAW7M9R3_9MICO|nr:MULTISPECIES: LacI family DNA-binding transcriptional regulator [unclassified Demequina]MDN4478797.1 LacI family DNA-binding transcriptional regulator [Demequina sp. SYSU T00039-1]MDN4488895.1 LacI family DNA-binding transcriptional regulator [Demequina sp. SYSU T00039]MDN4490313.1 LacI family DNA-binding transcriptional regulator [Demequina sp. SYSU T00068]
MTTTSRAHAPTLEAVAARAGVSRATVSRVVNGSPTVSAPIAEAVRQAITELGYVPNRAARSLASQRAQAIALIVPEDVGRFFGDLFISDVVAGIDERLEDSDYVLNLMIANHDPTGKTMRYLAGGAVDGAIVVSHHTSDKFLGRLVETLPVVFSGRSTMGDDQVNVVDVDNRHGGWLATRRLIERGCRRIGIITGPLTMQGATDRLAGWRDALDEAGLEPGPVADGDFTMVGGVRAMREILDTHGHVDGMFISSDLMASGAIPVLLSRGLRVPEDVAVVGFDDSSAATSTAVQLTTVRQPSREMGRLMAQMLFDVLDGRIASPNELILPTELVVRDSA